MFSAGLTQFSSGINAAQQNNAQSFVGLPNTENNPNGTFEIRAQMSNNSINNMNMGNHTGMEAVTSEI